MPHDSTFGTMGSRHVDATETHDLIASDKVEGTTVYGSDGNSIGSIARVMIDKRKGHVAYAVLSFGGFLGMGKEYHPLPWSSLTYNEDLGGYEVSLTEDQLRNAPKYSSEGDWNWSDMSTTRRIDDYYGTSPRLY